MIPLEGGYTYSRLKLNRGTTWQPDFRLWRPPPVERPSSDTMSWTRCIQHASLGAARR